MRVDVRLYASFAATEFGGNIAGIVYDETGLSAAQMQGIAADLGAPTTGFVHRQSDDAFQVRFFSTRSEMGMCGHVTVGIFVALADDGRLGRGAGIYRQLTSAGEIGVEVTKRNARPYVSMRQKPPVFDLIQVETSELAALLGLSSKVILSVEAASTALSHLFVEVVDEQTLAAITADDTGLRAISKARAIDTLCVWCRKQTTDATALVRLRDFCHGVGDPEEAASGTTNGALACMLCRQGVVRPDDNGIIDVEAEQGFEMGRPSRVSTRLLVRDGAVTEVTVGGSATRRLVGQVQL